MNQAIVIDCCAGAYEGLALAMAAKTALEIKAVTVNALFEAPAKALADVSGLCAAFGISAPVVLGAAQPIIAGVRPLTDRYPRLPEGFVTAGVAPAEGYAWDEIYKQAKAANGNLRIICLGPLTNLAIALFKYPELKNMLAQVVVYSGALDWGNVSQTAEVNAAADPHALDALSKSGLPTVLVPWSETRLAGADEALLAKEIPGELLALLKNREKIPLEESLVLNHAMAVLFAAGRGGFEAKPHIIRVETRGRLCMGRTCANLMYTLKKDPPNMEVVRRIDMAALFGGDAV